MAIAGESAPLDGLEWLHPGSKTSVTSDPVALAIDAAQDGVTVFADEPLRRRLAGHGIAARALGAACIVVGPDGAPLWRRSDPDVPALRDAGYEPEGIRRFVAPEARGLSVRFLSSEAMARANREAILALDPGERLARLKTALRTGGFALEGERLARAWRALAPKIRRLTEAPERLAFLRPDWRRPPLRVSPPWEGCELRPEALPDADALVDLLGDDPRARPRLRRLLRWALTGQSVAPRLDDVWDLLGPAEVVRRLRGGGHEPLELPANPVIVSR